MKKITYYIFLMIILTVVMPLLIVKGCSNGEKSGTVPRGKNSSNIDVKNGVKIVVFMHNENQIKEVYLDEYLKGVVAAEMPAEFELEALKAQAVAARTYAFSKIKNETAIVDEIHPGAHVCTDHNHCQAWISKEDAMKGWDLYSAERYWDKIEAAVKETSNQIITYNKNVIDQAVFHANSGGKTENSEEVWSNEVPYLRSVQSFGEEAAREFRSVVTIKAKEFCEKLKSEMPNIKINEKDPIKDIKVISYSEGGRVKSIKVGSVTVKGTDIRRIFSLKSTNFKIEKEGGDTLKITTIGNGHGVGMSQWGANYLAKCGGTYQEILKYYYKGVEIEILGNK